MGGAVDYEAKVSSSAESAKRAAAIDIEGRDAVGPQTTRKSAGEAPVRLDVTIVDEDLWRG